MEIPMRIIAHPSPEGFDNERTKMSHEFIDWAMMTYEQALEHLGDHIKEVCEPKTLGYYDQLLTAIESCSVRDKEVNPFDRKAFAAAADAGTTLFGLDAEFAEYIDTGKEKAEIW